MEWQQKAAPIGDLRPRPEPMFLLSPWQASTCLRVALPVKDTSRFRQGRLLGCIRILGLGRKLQHSRALAFAKMREQYDLAARKLQRIMVRAGVVHVHLPEPCD